MNLESLTKENLQHSLCRFVPEVTKRKGDGLYPGKTLYQMIVAIQKYLWINKLKWKLVEGAEFDDLKTVLDNVMKERTQANIGVVTKQAELITYDMERKLWDKGVLGESNPDQLRNTVLFLLGVNLYLCAMEDHYNLCRNMSYQQGQILFELSEKGVRCLVYREDCTTKTHDGGLKDMRADRKIVWVYPSKDVTKCPVHLTQKYLSLYPKYEKNSNFYLHSLDKPSPKQWYAEQVVGAQTLSKVIWTIMELGEFKGFFTNHSARRTGGTRLFRAGVQRKLVKECTRHQSDAVDKYQIRSDEQRQQLCEIISNEHASEVREVREENGNVTDPPVQEKEASCMIESERKSEKVHVSASNVSDIVSNIMSSAKGKGKTTIKFQIEIVSE